MDADVAKLKAFISANVPRLKLFLHMSRGMTNLILLILCFIAGMLLHRFKRMPVNTPAVLNSFIIHVSFPALTLLSLHDLKLSGDIGLMAAMAWLCFATVGRFLLVARALAGSAATPRWAR